MASKKKQILTATLIIALTAAVAVNWYYTNNPIISPEEETTGYSDSASLGDSLLVAGSSVKESTTASLDTSDVSKSDTDASLYFSEAKVKRNQSHDEIIEEIEDFIDDDSISQEDKSEIVKMLNSFKDCVKKETDAENLIKAKIGSDCIVTVNDGTANVVVSKGVLNDTVIMQITDIFEKNTGILAENLTIIEAK